MTNFRDFSPLNLSNHTAADLLPGISPRLGTEIIRTAVNHHGPSNDLLRSKPSRLHCQKGPSSRFQQRRQIPAMPGMFLVLRIPVPSDLRKFFSAAAVPFMDVKAEKAVAVFGQSLYFRCHQGPSGHAVEGHAAPKPMDSPHPGHRPGPS